MYAPIGALPAELAALARTPAGKIALSEAQLALRAGEGVRTISIVEAGYSGAFTLANSRPAVARATLTGAGPGLAQLILAPQTQGTTLVTVADANGNSATVQLTVSWRSFGTLRRRGTL
jgi:hypothetical protein